VETPTSPSNSKNSPKYPTLVPTSDANCINGPTSRAAAAWLARRLTMATLRELQLCLGLGRPESVSNMTRRIDRVLAKDFKLKKDLAVIEKCIVLQVNK
jgi:hypothetical protein